MKAWTLITKKLERAAVFIPGLTSLLRIYYRYLVSREIDLGKISPDDRVLCIGGGPLPSTALEIAQKTGAKVQVIDNDVNSVKIAREMVNRLDLDDMVKIDYGEGQRVDVSNFSVVHVAYQAQPHDEIFQNVWCNAAAGTRIMIRRQSITRNTVLFTKVHRRREHEKVASWRDSAFANYKSSQAG